MKQLLRFAIVGAVGFVVDFTVLYLAVSVLGLGNLSGRVLSFIVAATVTWKFNRHFTFEAAGKNAFREWAQYLLATSVGGGINVAVYQCWLWFTDTRTLNLFLGVAAGSAVAMMFNFAISKRIIFAAKPLP